MSVWVGQAEYTYYSDRPLLSLEAQHLISSKASPSFNIFKYVHKIEVAEVDKLD